MSGTTDKDSSSKYTVYTFSGNKEKFNEWKVKTLSLSRVKRVNKLLTHEVDFMTEEEAEIYEAEGSNDSKEKVRYLSYEKNIKAYDLLIRSCTGTPLNIIETVEDGNAFKAWTKLLNKYETKIDDVQTLEDLWSASSLESVQVDPTDWFLKLTHINKMLSSIDEKYKKDPIQIAGFILNNATKEYSTVITSLESSGKGKDVDAIKEAFEKHWEKHYKAKGKKEEAYNVEHKFSGKCNYCGIPGHKEAVCRKKKADLNKKSGGNGNTKGKLECWICGGNHVKKECPKYKAKSNTSDANQVNSIFSELFMCVFIEDTEEDPKETMVPKATPTISYRDALMQEVNCNEIIKESDEEEVDDEDTIPEIGYCSFCTSSGMYANPCECGGMYLDEIPPLVKKKYDSDSDDEESDDDEVPPLKARFIDDEDDEDVEVLELTQDEIQDATKAKENGDGCPLWGWCDSCGKAGYYACPCICDDGFYLHTTNPNTYHQNNLESTIKDFSEINLGNDDDEENTNEVNHMNMNKSEEYSPEEFLGDTGATTHIVSKMNGIKDISVQILGKMKVGNGDFTSVKAKGNLLTETSDGHTVELINTHVVPNITKNIISITQLLHEGWMLGGSKDKMILKQNDKVIYFYAKERNLYYTSLRRINPEEVNNNVISDSESDDESCKNNTTIKKKVEIKIEPTEESPQTSTSIDINKAHRIWGHCNETSLKERAKLLGLTLKGTMKNCDGCGAAKVKCNPIAKTTNTKAEAIGERMFIDTSGPFPPSIGGNRYWLGAVDDKSNKMFNSFGKSKDGMYDFVESLFKQLKSKGSPCRYLRCDNAGEHMCLKDLCLEHGVDIEFTPPHSPQYNGRIERRFAVVLQRATSLMFSAGMKVEFRNKVWAEAVATSSFLGDLFPTARSSVPADELFRKKKSEWYPYLIEFGRIGMVTSRAQKKKMEAPGTPMIMVGYALNHKAGSYRMYNPTTKKILICDNIKWTTFTPWKVQTELKEFEEIKTAATEAMAENVTYDSDSDDSINEDITTAGSVLDSTSPSKSSKQQRELRKLDTSYNPTEGDKRVTGDTTVHPIGVVTRSARKDPVAIIEAENEEGNIVEHHIHFCFNTSLNSDDGEPKTFKQAMQSSDKEMWKAAITSEINNFLKRGAWKLVNKAEVYKRGRKAIGTKHVFKKKIQLDPITSKEFTRYKDRIVTLGYMQIPGVDYTESFSPVATDTALRLTLGMVLYYQDEGWECHSFDVEAAFLEPPMGDTEVYITLPDGLVELGFITKEEAESKYIKLENSMYGNVDTAFRWIVLFTDYLTSSEIGMTQSRSDPCVLYKKSEDGIPILIVVITVDDCAVSGKVKAIDWLMTKVEIRFKITRGGILRKHLGVDYEWKRDNENELYIEASMNRKLKDIVKVYEEYIGKPAKTYRTPGSPGTVMRKNEEGKEPVDITPYRSLVGKIMFFATKLGPKLVNNSREMATHMANPGPEQWKEMGHLIGHIKTLIDKPAMILRKPMNLRVISFLDSSYASCGDTRKSVSGELHTIGGMITSFSSRTQKTVALSSAESEYMTTTSGSQEVMFQQMLLAEVAETEIPAIMFEDNEGAIFLSANKQVSQRTKHIDLRYHFVRNFIKKGKDGFSRAVLAKVHTKENYADLMTKSVDGKVYEYLGNDIDNGLKRFREEKLKDEEFIQSQVGGMSRVFKYEPDTDNDLGTFLDKMSVKVKDLEESQSKDGT